MANEVKTIHKGRYLAFDYRGSLIVQLSGRQGGKRLEGEQAATWIDAIKTALDKAEADALCRVVYTS